MWYIIIERAGMDMSAVLTHDTLLNILMLELEAEDMTISYHLPINLKDIKELTDYEEGFLTMETNYGEEYADFIELLETTPFADKGFVRKCESILEKLKLEDIELRRS